MKRVSKSVILVGWLRTGSVKQLWNGYCSEVPEDRRITVQISKYRDHEGKWTKYTFVWRED